MSTRERDLDSSFLPDIQVRLLRFLVPTLWSKYLFIFPIELNKVLLTIFNQIESWYYDMFSKSGMPP
jgi:hypothetical protein